MAVLAFAGLWLVALRPKPPVAVEPPAAPAAQQPAKGVTAAPAKAEKAVAEANATTAKTEKATPEPAPAPAAKRLLVSGNRLLLERRARELAQACELPLAALDRGLATWGTPGGHADPVAEPPAAIRSALALR